MSTFLNTATILSLLLGVVIPHLSSLLSSPRTPIPVWAAGYTTIVLSGLTGLLTEWAANPDHFDWKRGALNSGVALAFSLTTRKTALADTPVDANLISLGAARSKRRPRPTPSGRHEAAA